MNLFKLFLIFTLLTLTLQAGIGMGGGGMGGGSSSSDTKQFDTWDYWIGDSHNLPSSDDRNISTKIAGKAFQLTLACIDKDDKKYEKKKASSDSTKDYSVEVSIYTNNANNPTLISNTVKFDPTNDKYINKSVPITVDKAYKDAVVGIRMCATYKDSKYEMYEMSSCSGRDQDCTHETNSDNPEFKMCYATNNFAIRPKLYNITPIRTLISGKEQSFDVIAEDENGAATKNYSIDNDGKTDSGEAIQKIIDTFNSFINGGTTANSSTDDYDLNLTVTKYMPDDSVNSDLYGKGNITVYKFTDGNATQNEGNITIYYNEVGKVTLTPMDQNWSDVDQDDTPEDCNNGVDDDGNDDPEKTGRFICGDTNTTYIPSHFTFHDAQLYDHNDSIFTYISNDDNMSAHVGVKIEAQNDKNETTRNFDIDSWVHPVTVDFITTHENNISKNFITDTNLSFEDGNYTVIWNDNNSSANLMFNYERNSSDALNPFFIDGNESNFTLLSSYNDYDITDNNGKTISIDGNATFIYGRTNAPRTRFKEVNSNKYSATIYYESFCHLKDSADVDCNKSLLPDGDSSMTSDDPRWFINTKHNNTNNQVGLASNIQQKNGKTLVTQKEAPSGDYKDSVALKLDTGHIKLPYITTMENNASSWLIYNKYNQNATTNEFEVEFNKDSSGTSWAGKAENGTGSTKSTATSITNRRSMW